MAPTSAEVMKALSTVIDPEIRRSIVDLDMVEAVEVSPNGHVTVQVLLTVATCPLQDTIVKDIRAQVGALAGVRQVEVQLGAMSPQQRADLREKLQGGARKRTNPFTQPGNLTRIYAIASGKGGVGKSSVTANVAVAMAQSDLRVGIIDADIYGFSIPAALGLSGSPTKVDDMILPQVAHGVKVMSIGMFVGSDQAVVWRGPMLHRALEQFLTDVYWGDLDVLLLDLPPGTGDIAISVAQLLPRSELVVVTTPQQAAAQVAERAGTISTQTKQQVAGVVENMSYLDMPDGSKKYIFGAGGGQLVAQRLSAVTDSQVPLLGEIPLDEELRAAGDAGTPVVLSAPQTPAAQVLRTIANDLSHRQRGLSGLNLGIQVK